MSSRLQFCIFIAIFFYYIFLSALLRQRKLSLKYSLLWFFSGLLMLILNIFPSLLTIFSNLVGIENETNCLFAIVIFCILVILVSLTSIVTKQNEKNKSLVQNVAILEKRIRDLEKNNF